MHEMGPQGGQSGQMGLRYFLVSLLGRRDTVSPAYSSAAPLELLASTKWTKDRDREKESDKKGYENIEDPDGEA